MPPGALSASVLLNTATRTSESGALRRINRPPTTPLMALEATLGTANLLQLAEALSVNAERVS